MSGLRLGGAGGQHGKRVTCWRGKLCTSAARAAALREDRVFPHSEPAARQRAAAWAGEVAAEPGGWEAGQTQGAGTTLEDIPLAVLEPEVRAHPA